jgi:hypothetical protein
MVRNNALVAAGMSMLAVANAHAMRRSLFDTAAAPGWKYASCYELGTSIPADSCAVGKGDGEAGTPEECMAYCRRGKTKYNIAAITGE